MINPDCRVLAAAGQLGVPARPEGEPGDGGEVGRGGAQDCPLPPASAIMIIVVAPEP